ncbi:MULTISPECIES: MBL fold metallo-hydrolase [Methanobacterium]|uniref:MBL fold metallo-hydrolase n=1 Tax=Methanobacterium veterum TaxID=408577 RepID=A0A9E5A9N6_9EURY|nr:MULTISPECIES: MBL fold metallo-hydrolase [Methanobacterium]MCZ3366955.1 MBL fold metallo-hydrolase [Methanobacterium veterum]MCZ3373898.1 MBL fold metallo-hydrolase [Methanobacterium veterum]
MADAFATITQRRMTGGLRIDKIDGKNIHIDPGPGALVRTYQFGLTPLKLDAVMVSHSHTDHYTDAEVLIEAMTKGMTRKKGTVVGSKSVIEGYKQWGPCISKYHLSKPDISILGVNETAKLGKIKIKGTKTIHGDPTAVGFNLKVKNFSISYTADTEYFEDLHKYHSGADVLIASVIRPRNEKIRGHMSTHDFAKLVDEVSPRLAIMTHLGMKMVVNDAKREADSVKEQTGVNTFAAYDGMKINLDQFMPKQETLDSFR